MLKTLHVISYHFISMESRCEYDVQLSRHVQLKSFTTQAHNGRVHIQITPATIEDRVLVALIAMIESSPHRRWRA
jgi:hypothetical protein